MAISSENRAYYKALGARIASLRRQQRMTQAELARVLGVSQQTIFAYEIGERRVGVAFLPLLSRTLGVPVAELIGADPLKVSELPPLVVRQVERIAQLPKEQQRMILRLIDALVENAGL